MILWIIDAGEVCLSIESSGEETARRISAKFKRKTSVRTNPTFKSMRYAVSHCYERV